MTSYQSKKKTPITDLMAYHLSQLFQETSAQSPMDPLLTEQVNKALVDTEKFNGMELVVDEQEVTEQLNTALYQEVNNVLKQSFKNIQYGPRSKLSKETDDGGFYCIFMHFYWYYLYLEVNLTLAHTYKRNTFGSLGA